jgi:hypothetical protein
VSGAFPGVGATLMPFDPANVRILPPSLREASHTVHLPPVPPERDGGGGPRRVRIKIEIIDRRAPPQRRSGIGTLLLWLMLDSLVHALANSTTADALRGNMQPRSQRPRGNRAAARLWARLMVY